MVFQRKVSVLIKDNGIRSTKNHQLNLLSTYEKKGFDLEMIIVFDLDGTLSDPALGMTSSLNYALNRLGLPEQRTDRLTKYIGPPLEYIFQELLQGLKNQDIDQAIALYREQYFRTGYKENILYPEIKTTLTRLKTDGHCLYVATAKQPQIAKAIIDYFDLTSLFKAILGCGLKREKQELLKMIREEEHHDLEMAMVGDRSFDMIAGKALNCFCIGALWGYGSHDELLNSGADILLEAPEGLLHCFDNRN